MKVVIDNDRRDVRVGQLLQAIYWNCDAGPMPAALTGLLLTLDINEVEDDLRRAVAKGL